MPDIALQTGYTGRMADRRINPYEAPQTELTPRPILPAPPPRAGRFILLGAVLGALPTGLIMSILALVILTHHTGRVGYDTIFRCLAMGMVGFAIGGSIGMLGASGLLMLRWIRWWRGPRPAAT